MKRVICMIYSEVVEFALPSDVLDASFDVWWPHLSREATAKLQRFDEEAPSARRSDRELLEEVLALTRMTAQLSARGRLRRPTRNAAPKRERPPVGSLSRNEVLSRVARVENLSGANLIESSLSKADLSRADLRGANLVRANLVGANLTNANLSAANLEGATLDRSDLLGVDLSKANLWRASMEGVRNLPLAADVTEANFFEVYGLSAADKDFLTGQKVLSLGDYPSFFAYYRGKGLTREQMADVFLWTSNSGYPDVGSLL
jgi:hypothetical protein